ncbi:MAG: sulfatase-like hydrolase/transferase [Acidimicrobiales bacterium]
MPAAPAPPGRVRRFAELLALNGIIVAEPVLTALRQGADVFVSRRAGRLDIVALTLLLVLGLPAVLFAIEELVGLVRRGRNGDQSRDRVHRILLGGLGGLVVVRLLGDAGLPGPFTVLLAVAGGAVLWQAVTRWEGPRLWLQVLGVFPLLLGAWFLATDPVRGLVLDPASTTGDAAAVGAPAPVVLVVLDEFPLASILDADDRIDPEQFPNLAHLADDATWFRNATGVSPTTPEAVPPILTGRYPDAVGVLPTAEEHPNNIFTLLQGTYGFHVQESVTQLCPAHLCAEGALAIGNPLAELTRDSLDLWQRQLFGGGDDRQVDFAIRQSDPDAPTTINEFAAGIGRGDRPELDVLHAVYPHQPWYHLPSGLTYEAPFIAEGLDQYAQYAWKTDFAAESGRQRHLLQARHADVMLGVILARLQELDTYDDTLIVVTADHGAAFETGEPIRGVSEGNADSVLWVPLLVKPPRQTTGRIDDRPAHTIDVLPTMADVLELDLPDGTDGVSLLGPEPATGPDERRVYAWGFNRLEPNADGYSLIDGTQGFADLLAQPAPGEGDDPDLRFYRFGRHADLIGRQVDDLPAAPELDNDVHFDADGSYRSSADAQQDVYVAGEIETGEPLDVAVVVNGRIGGWAELQATGDPGERRFWAVVPPAFLREEGTTDTIELYVIQGDGPDPALAPLGSGR